MSTTNTSKAKTRTTTKKRNNTSAAAAPAKASAAEVYSLPASTTIFEAQDVHRALFGGAKKIDVSNVNQIDLCIVQLLVAAQKHDPSVQIVGTSPALTQAYAAAGLG